MASLHPELPEGTASSPNRRSTAPVPLTLFVPQTFSELIDQTLPTFIGVDPESTDPSEQAAVDAYIGAHRQGEMTGRLLAESLLFHGNETAAANSQRRIEELEHTVITDRLTGLPNKYGFIGAYKNVQQMQKALPAAFVMFDLDGFKEVNDVLGHDAGDGLLIDVAHHVGLALRTGDVLARLHGDEFGVLLQQVSLDEAVAIMQRVVNVVRAHSKVTQASKGIGSTLSVGVVPVNPSMPYEQISETADKIMYRAKERGKDQVAWFGDEYAMPA